MFVGSPFERLCDEVYKPDQEELEEIDKIIEAFDFDKVHKYMKAANWTWALTGVPNIDQLKEAAKEHLIRAVTSVKRTQREHWTSFCSSGGLLGEAMQCVKGGKIYMRLSFVLTDWDNWE